MLRIGIVGTGIIAREHAQAIAASSGRVRLVAATDVDSNRLRDFAGAFDVPAAHASAAELIADPTVDLVAVTTPPVAHEELTIAALDRGKYVLCEKPLAHSLASAVRIADAAARRPGRMSVSYQLRYDPANRRLEWLCRNGWLGAIRSAFVERHGTIPHAEHGKTGWWGAWDVAGGGVLITQLIHQIDLLVTVMGTPIAVTAEADTRHTDIESEDHLDATIRFAGGRTARCVASVNSGRSGGRFAIVGESGSVELPWRFTAGDPTRTAEALRALDRAMPETRPPSSSLLHRGSRSIARRLKLAGRPEPTPHARMYLDIADRIRTGRPLPIPPAEALVSLELCMAIYESAIGGREITLPLEPGSAVFGGVTKEQYRARMRPASRAARSSAVNISRTNGVRVGLVGLDTSHAPTFTKHLHDPADPFHIPGARVVAAYPGGSADMHISSSRVGGFTAELRDTYGVPILDTPEQVADASDLVLVLSSDGRAHPTLFRSVAGRGKPVFLDKPFATSGAGARTMFNIAAETNTKLFASSAFRYADGLVDALAAIRESGERIRSCTIRCWLPVEETQGRYFWYGIHASEMLLAIMGRGIRDVLATRIADQDTIAVRHADGRESTIVGSQSDRTFHVTIELESRRVEIPLAGSMSSLSARLLRTVLDVLTDGEFPPLWRATPVGSVTGRPGRQLDPTPEETVEVIQLLDAAQQSLASGQRASL